MENVEREDQREQEMENVEREEQREQEMENVEREDQREQEMENVGREEQREQEIQNVVEEEQREHVENDPTTHNRQQLKPLEVFQKFSDPVRSIVSEVLIYLLLIISLFQFVTGKGYDPSNAVERISLALFIINILFLITGVYLVRIITLVTFIRIIRKLKYNLPNDSDRPFLFFSIRLSTMLMSLWTIHIIGQMITQLVLLFYIGLRIHYENSAQMESLNISWQLCLLIIGGFFLPILGTVVFFSSVYYWIQDFSLSLFLGLLELLKKEAFPDAVFEKEDINDEKKKILARKLIEEIHYEEVLTEYNRLHRAESFLFQVGHSYRNPFIVAICIVFTFLLCGYITCMFSVPQEALNDYFEGFIFPVLFLVVISNLHAICIATFWTSPPISMVIIFVTFGCMLCCSEVHLA